MGHLHTAGRLQHFRRLAHPDALGEDIDREDCWEGIMDEDGCVAQVLSRPRPGGVIAAIDATDAAARALAHRYNTQPALLAACEAAQAPLVELGRLKHGDTVQALLVLEARRALRLVNEALAAARD